MEPSTEPGPDHPITDASRLVLIDNYDSFTWNVYQFLVLEGANVSVYRNDKISLQELIALEPTQLVVSPGPGHPEHDAGISLDAIRHFSGKIPVLGVCMGAQCIITVFGGHVDTVGEILHGKTSALQHDGKGIYANLPQELPVTRYHSLAGKFATLPESLEVSSWTANNAETDTGRVIMGVRHKQYVLEGVQFHPESILTAEGRKMLGNFLKMRGGTWADATVDDQGLSNNAEGRQVGNGASGRNSAAESSRNSPAGRSILHEIYSHRRKAVAAQMAVPSQRLYDLQAAYDLNIAPPQISFLERLKRSPFRLSLMAEIKRASPSKGVISLMSCAPAQARTYALAGASVISVLTEPEWFKGTIDDLRAARQALEGFPDRPAILRKDFVFNEYQILEARLAGADSVLLIVKMLEQEVLFRLYRYAQSLGMEPLVEVNNEAETKVAVDMGARVIGVNNRNLTSFEVDLDTTTRLLDHVPDDTLICALSGISSSADVEAYKTKKVSAVLVGEALMRAANPAQFARELLGHPQSDDGEKKPRPLLVKVCGTRTADAARVAINAGADFIGIILVEGRARSVSPSAALEISAVVHKGHAHAHSVSNGDEARLPSAVDFFQYHVDRMLSSQARPLLVGVFQNQSLSFILAQQRLLNLDVVQLHGSEPLEWASLIPVPVIRSFKPGDPGIGRRGYHMLPLLDSAEGGSGQKLHLAAVISALEKDAGLRAILAGGLNADNVESTIRGLGGAGDRIVGVDVSSGVEKDGVQDADRIRAFVRAAKTVR